MVDAWVIDAYSKNTLDDWTKIVDNSKHNHFMYHRAFMEYHSDRFEDASLVIKKNGQTRAIFIGNVIGKSIICHSGLTFGGLVVDFKVQTEEYLDIFGRILEYFKTKEMTSITFKVLPWIYHKVQFEADLYALFRFSAKLIARDVSTTIDLARKYEWNVQRKRSLKKATKAGLNYEISDDWKGYWQVLADNLDVQHSVKPVHTINEIEYLRSLFPENIKLFVTKKENEIIAGTVIFETDCVAHAQYIAISESSRSLGALDGLFGYLIEHYENKKKYFDFGISTENQGRHLNAGLLNFKEGFAGSSIVHDTYELIL